VFGKLSEKYWERVKNPQHWRDRWNNSRDFLVLCELETELDSTGNPEKGAKIY
jgi:hypothetical protein